MKPNYWIVSLAFALVVTNGYWFIQVLDAGVSLTYSRDSAKMASDMYREAVRLANLDLKGLTAEEALASIGDDLNGSPAFEKPSEKCIYVGQVCVKLNDERVVVGIGE